MCQGSLLLEQAADSYSLGLVFIVDIDNTHSDALSLSGAPSTRVRYSDVEQLNAVKPDLRFRRCLKTATVLGDGTARRRERAERGDLPDSSITEVINLWSTSALFPLFSPASRDRGRV